MQSALRVTTTVRPGGKIEVADPQLPSGQSVDVIVLFRQPLVTGRRSIVDILAEAPGQILFHTPEDVEAYLREERDAWDR
jgi:hypothetical protein